MKALSNRQESARKKAEVKKEKKRERKQSKLELLDLISEVTWLGKVGALGRIELFADDLN